MYKTTSAKIVLPAAGIVLAVLFTSSLGRPQTAPTTKVLKAEDKTPENLPRIIRHQLLTLPFYSVFDNLTFSIDGRKVTLNGQVIRKTLKEHAETSVRSIEGVDLVVNNIEVLPASTSDDELRRDIYRAIFEDALLARYAVPAVPSIHIIVRNGAVSLEGTIDSEEDKVQASKRAGTVVSLPAVRNNLTVRKPTVPGN